MIFNLHQLLFLISLLYLHIVILGNFIAFYNFKHVSITFWICYVLYQTRVK